MGENLYKDEKIFKNLNSLQNESGKIYLNLNFFFTPRKVFIKILYKNQGTGLGTCFRTGFEKSNFPELTVFGFSLTSLGPVLQTSGLLIVIIQTSLYGPTKDHCTETVIVSNYRDKK